MNSSPTPITTKEWKRVMKQNSTVIFTASVHRPAFPESSKTARIERYFSYFAQQWISRWETVLYPAARNVFAEAQAQSKCFLPWTAALNYVITFQRPPLVSLYLEVSEHDHISHPRISRFGETWDCSTGYPRTLRSFFPPHSRRWKKELLDSMKAQAVQQLNSGESLLNHDCVQIMDRTFDPDRFYLTDHGVTLFYPLYVLGPYAEGIPTFTVPLK